MSMHGWHRLSPGLYETTHLYVGRSGRYWWVVWRKDNDRQLVKETSLRRAKEFAITNERLKELADKRDEEAHVQESR